MNWDCIARVLHFMECHSIELFNMACVCKKIEAMIQKMYPTLEEQAYKKWQMKSVFTRNDAEFYIPLLQPSVVNLDNMQNGWLEYSNRDFPMELHSAVQKSPDDSSIKYLHMAVINNNIPYLKRELKTLFLSDHHVQELIQEAVKANKLEMLQLIIEIQFAGNIEENDFGVSWQDTIFAYATKFGSLDTIKWLDKTHSSCKRLIGKYFGDALNSGSLKMVKYFLNHPSFVMLSFVKPNQWYPLLQKCSVHEMNDLCNIVDIDVLMTIIDEDLLTVNLPVSEWLMAQRPNYELFSNGSAFLHAVKNDDISLLKWVIKKKFAVPDNFAQSYFRRNVFAMKDIDDEILQWFWDNKLFGSQNFRALHIGLFFTKNGPNIKGIEWTLKHFNLDRNNENDLGLLSRALNAVIDNGLDLEYTQLLCCYGAIPDAFILGKAPRSIDLIHLQWLCENYAATVLPALQSASGKTMCINATKSGNLEMIQWLNDCGYPILNQACLLQAVLYGNNRNIRWFISKGCTFRMETERALSATCAWRYRKCLASI